MPLPFVPAYIGKTISHVAEDWLDLAGKPVVIQMRPVTGRMFLGFKDLLETASAAISRIFDVRTNDVGMDTVSDIGISNDVAQSSITRNLTTSITPELAKMRSDNRASAFGSLVSALLSEATQGSFFQLIFHSWVNRPPQLTKPDDIADLELPQLFQLLTAVIKANKGVAGPLAGTGVWKDLMKKATDRLAPASANSVESSPPNEP